MREGGVQRSAGDLNESRVGRVHLQDQEDRARNRQRGGEQAAHHGRIERGEEAETDEDDSEPENEHEPARGWKLNPFPVRTSASASFGDPSRYSAPGSGTSVARRLSARGPGFWHKEFQRRRRAAALLKR